MSEDAQRGRRAELRQEPFPGDITLTLDPFVCSTAAAIGLGSWDPFPWTGAERSPGWESVHAGP